jgi:RHS repeat-associated protein
VGLRYAFEYDPDGRMVKETRFDGSTLTLEYDLDGMCVATTNAAGQRVTLERDAGGRLAKKKLSDGSEVSFTYDPHNYIIEAANKDCVVQFHRDPLGFVVKEVQDQHGVESGYNHLGAKIWRRTSLNHRAEFEYDNDGQLVGVTLPQGRAQIVRDAMGREIERRLTGGATIRSQYDILGRLSEQRLQAAGERAFDKTLSVGTWLRRFTHDRNSNLLEIEDSQRGPTHYEYDATDRITLVQRGNEVVEQFEYDVGGNLVTVPTRGEERAFDERGRLREAGETHYEYDGAGRLVARVQLDRHGRERRWTFSWNDEDRLTEVLTPEGDSWHYAYDALGRRVQKSGEEGTTRYVWDGNTLTHEIGPDQSVKTWVFEPDTFTPFAKVEEDTAYFVVSDPNGTPSDLIRGDGGIAWSARLKTWGDVDRLYASAVDCPVRFPGQWQDAETGLCYNWFRYYDPSKGVYISPDPLGLQGGSHLYQYVPNPLAWADPLGLAGVGGGPYDVDSAGNFTRIADGSRVPIGRDQCSAILTTPSGTRQGFLSGWGEGVTNYNAARGMQHGAIQNATRGGPLGNWCHAEMHALNHVLQNPSRFPPGTTVTLQIRFPPCTQGGTGCQAALGQLRGELAARGIKLVVRPRNVHT